jgi:hypothetical protein
LKVSNKIGNENARAGNTEQLNSTADSRQTKARREDSHTRIAQSAQQGIEQATQATRLPVHEHWIPCVLDADLNEAVVRVDAGPLLRHLTQTQPSSCAQAKDGRNLESDHRKFRGSAHSKHVEKQSGNGRKI